MTSKPREWVIDDAYDLIAGPHPGKERITVIEKSAYDELKETVNHHLGLSIGGRADVARKIVEERDALKASCEELVAALRAILHRGNVAMQGKWEDTVAMKDVAYQALAKHEERMKGLT